jgi:hypothetical protein
VVCVKQEAEQEMGDCGFAPELMYFATIPVDLQVRFSTYNRPCAIRSVPVRGNSLPCARRISAACV